MDPRSACAEFNFPAVGLLDRGGNWEAFIKQVPTCHFLLCGVHSYIGYCIAPAGMEDAERPWLKDFVHTPAAKDPEPGATRLRPLIYV